MKELYRHLDNYLDKKFEYLQHGPNEMHYNHTAHKARTLSTAKIECMNDVVTITYKDTGEREVLELVGQGENAHLIWVR